MSNAYQTASLLVVVLILGHSEPVQQLPHWLDIAQPLVAAVAAVTAAAAAAAEGGHAQDGLQGEVVGRTAAVDQLEQLFVQLLPLHQQLRILTAGQHLN